MPFFAPIETKSLYHTFSVGRYFCLEQPVQAPNQKYWCCFVLPKRLSIWFDPGTQAGVLMIRAYCQLYYCGCNLAILLPLIFIWRIWLYFEKSLEILYREKTDTGNSQNGQIKNSWKCTGGIGQLLIYTRLLASFVAPNSGPGYVGRQTETAILRQQ